MSSTHFRNPGRRRFLGFSAFSTAAFDLGMLGRPAHAATRSASRPAATPALPAPRQIDAGPLSVGYVEMGPADGPVIVVVPYLRGYGTTMFRSAVTPRNAQQAALAADAVALMDALGIRRAIFAGFDWGARTADCVAALWPERCIGLVSVSGYLIGSQQANAIPLPPKAELSWWYQFYFATERGRLGYARNTKDFNRLIWQLASPKWNFDDATYDRSARAFENPDHVAVVIHNYR